jgi:hypothetical protein
MEAQNNSENVSVSDLRIGNLIGLGGSICNVVEIQKNIFYVEDEHGAEFKNTTTDLKPILLTEEWLLKLGFEKIESSNFDYQLQVQNSISSGQEESYIWVDLGDVEEEWADWDFPRTSIVTESYWIKTNAKSIHQLQNLYFSITGKELKLKEN